MTRKYGYETANSINKARRNPRWIVAGYASGRSGRKPDAGAKGGKPNKNSVAITAACTIDDDTARVCSCKGLSNVVLWCGTTCVKRMRTPAIAPRTTKPPTAPTITLTPTSDNPAPKIPPRIANTHTTGCAFTRGATPPPARASPPEPPQWRQSTMLQDALTL